MSETPPDDDQEPRSEFWWQQHERELRITLMGVQIDKTRLDIDRVHQELRWEPYKAIAVILAGIAAVSGIILGLAHIIH
jgi:hypothetical protein